MRRKLLFLCLLLVSITFFSCDNAIEERGMTGEKPLVYTSFFPIYKLTKMVAQDDVVVKSFMPTSATVHSWEPSAKDIKRLAKADLLIVNGANMERWVDKIK